MKEHEAPIDPRGKVSSPSVLLHSQMLNKFKNEPLYIFVDSLDYKFILFNLIQPGFTCLLKGTENHLKGSVDKVEGPTYASVSESKHGIIKSKHTSEINHQNHEKKTNCNAERVPKKALLSLGHLIVEDYNWQDDKTRNVRVFLSSVGTKSILTNLEKGRFCLRLWIDTNEHYILNILTDTNLVIGNLEMILDVMKTESHQLVNCCFNVSSAYGQLVQSLGTPAYPAALNKFYSTLKPNVNYKKQDFEAILALFFENLLEYLQRNLNEIDYNKSILALRILFLNSKIGSISKNIFMCETDIDNQSQGSVDQILLREIERAAVTIQAYFRGVYVRILKLRQNSSDKGFMNTFESLKRIYTTCFSVDKRLTACVDILRNILKKPDVAKFYSWVKDLTNVVDIEDFNGSSSVAFSNWIPICRYLFYCQSEHPAIVKICLFGEIDQCLIRVFDNESGKEMPR